MRPNNRQSHNSYRSRPYHGNGGSRSFRGPNGNSGGNRFKRRQKTFDPSLFVFKATQENVEEVFVPKHAFSDFPISSELKRNIDIRGYKTPTPIQDQAIPVLLQGRDVVGIANTGTGKTAAFLIPLIDKVLKDRSQKVLIVAPTRELAVQIEQEFKQFAQNMKLFSVLCIGGVGIRPQINALYREPHFVIGTPGRIRDLENQHKLHFGDYETIVLDEVDRMLDMGFIHEVKYITQRLPKPRQSLFFSATLPDSARGIMQDFLYNPVTISVKTRESSSNVDQDIVKLDGREKIDVLFDLITQDGFEKVLVFGRTKWGAEKLARNLEQRRIRVASIHGNKKQNQRQRAIDDFKNSRIQVLIATDIASRGLDINDVTHVINFDLPESYEDYIHRIGRTGRANKKGKALTFID